MHGAHTSIRTVLGLAALFLAGAVSFTWPLAIRLGRALPANLGDPLLNAIILGWNAQWLTGDRPGAFWDAPIFHPHEDTLAYSEHLIGQTLFVWPVFAVTGNALLTYNVALLGSFVICGVATYLWLHTLTGRRDVALVFALAVTFSPLRLGSQLSRVQMLSIGWLPLALWAVHRYGATRQRRYLAALTASVLLLVLSNMYALFLAALPLTWVAVHVIRRAGEHRRHVLAGLAAAMTVAAVLLGPVMLRYWSVDRRVNLEHTDDHTADYSAHVLSYVSVHSTSPALPWVRTDRTGDQALYPGLVLVLPLAVLAMSGIERAFGNDRQTARVYAGIALVALFLSFGPELRTVGGETIVTSPYAWVRDHVPGLSAVRAAGRFAAIVSFALAALGALIVARITDRTSPRARSIIAGSLALVVILEALPVALRVERIAPEGRPMDQALYGWLAQQPPAVMLELPASVLSAQVPFVELHHQYATLRHPHRLVTGYSGFSPPSADWFKTHHSPFIDLERLAEGVAYLRSINVRYVVLHPHDFARPGHAAEIVRRLTGMAGVTTRHVIDGHSVFELAAAAERADAGH